MNAIKWTKFAKAQPIGGEDPEAIFCRPEELYVFIPDIHIAMGRHDPCDGAKDPYDVNKTKLLYFLDYCKIAGATIVQTGDMLDFWTTEADMNIYYLNGEEYRRIPWSYTIPEEYEHNAKLRMRKRSDRLRLAADKILSEISSPTVTALLGKISHYVIGNHDWELMFPEAIKVREHIEKKCGITIHGTVAGWNFGNNVIVAHGHLYGTDANDTRASIDVNSAMNVPGKPITFSFARYKRNTPFPLIPLWEIDPAERNTLKETAIQSATENMAGWDVDTWMDWIADWNEFSGIRQGALNELLNRLQRANSSEYKFQLDEPNNIALTKNMDVFRDDARAILWEYNAGPLEMPKVPHRLIVHSHTHTAQLTKVKLSYGGATIRPAR
jgi:hypothetical protein